MDIVRAHPEALGGVRFHIRDGHGAFDLLEGKSFLQYDGITICASARCLLLSPECVAVIMPFRGYGLALECAAQCNFPET